MVLKLKESEGKVSSTLKNFGYWGEGSLTRGRIEGKEKLEKIKGLPLVRERRARSRLVVKASHWVKGSMLIEPDHKARSGRKAGTGSICIICSRV